MHTPLPTTDDDAAALVPQDAPTGSGCDCALTAHLLAAETLNWECVADTTGTAQYQRTIVGANRPYDAYEVILRRGFTAHTFPYIQTALVARRLVIGGGCQGEWEDVTRALNSTAAADLRRDVAAAARLQDAAALHEAARVCLAAHEATALAWLATRYPGRGEEAATDDAAASRQAYRSAARAVQHLQRCVSELLTLDHLRGAASVPRTTTVAAEAVTTLPSPVAGR